MYVGVCMLVCACVCDVGVCVMLVRVTLMCV